MAPLVAAGVHTPGSAVAGGPWTFHLHLLAWLAIGTLALSYSVGVRHVAPRSEPARVPTRRQLWYLAGGLTALAVALTWPLADLAAHWSLTALVVQRLLLTLAAAPLLLLAMPAPLLAMLTRPAPLDASLEFITRPVVAVATFTAIAVGTLLTPAVAAQASSAWWRALTDVGLLVAGAVLWGPVLRHIPGRHRTVPVGLAAYLFVQSVVPTFPAIIYVFARHPLYDAFRHVHLAFGMSRLVDQQLAGVVAKVATLPVLWSAAWVSLLRAQRIEAASADADADRAADITGIASGIGSGVGGMGSGSGLDASLDGAMDSDDGEPLTWAEVERQLERVARAERRGRAGRSGSPDP
jgi:putative membrane protein